MSNPFRAPATAIEHFERLLRQTQADLKRSEETPGFQLFEHRLLDGQLKTDDITAREQDRYRERITAYEYIIARLREQL